MIPAGNNGFHVDDPSKPIGYMGNNLPSALGSPDNNIITVGAVKANGKYAAWTSPEGCVICNDFDDIKKGSMTIWAQGADIQLIDENGKDTWGDGTSYAAPQVAGLAAYLMSLPENVDLRTWDPNGPQTQGTEHCQRIKQKLIDMAYERCPHDSQLSKNVPLPYDLPDSIKVAYNGAWGPQTGVFYRKRTLQSIYLLTCLDCTNAGKNPRMTSEGEPSDDDLDDTDYVCPLLPPTLMTSIVSASGSNAMTSTNGPLSITSVPLVETVTMAGVGTVTITHSLVSKASSHTKSSSTTASSTVSTKTRSSFTAKPTIYVSPSGRDGCANADCSQCNSDFARKCVDSGTSIVCHCQWRGGCMNGVPDGERGLCRESCGSPDQHRTCERMDDKNTYPYG